jgi:hypothetical protein
MARALDLRTALEMEVSMKRIIVGFCLLVLGLVAMAWLYSMRPLSPDQLAALVIQHGSIGRNYIGPPFYQAYLILAGLCSLCGAVLIFLRWPHRSGSAR